MNYIQQTKTKLLQLFVLVCFMFISANSFAQSKTISGTVVSSTDNSPLIGVNVVVKGTTVGTLTDIDGKYSIKVNSETDVVEFTYVGYVKQEITVANQSEINVALKEDVTALQEIVVVGYGTVKKEDLTGSVAVITASDLTKTPTPTIDKAIQGKAPGLLVSQTGKPGEGLKVRVRGIGSISRDGEPLTVIDGVVGASMNAVDPNDIESFQVLKDASATAIYGADGANGVIIITTKRGVKGKSKVTFSAFNSINQIDKKFELMDATQYSNFYNTLYPENGIAKRGAYTDAFRKSYYGEGWEKGTDWQSEMLQSSLTQNYYLSVSGGSDKSNYAISASVQDEVGTLINTGYKKYVVRANSDFLIGKYFKVGESISLTRTELQEEGTYQSSAWGTPLITSPLMKVENDTLKGGYEGPQIAYSLIEADTLLADLNTGGNDKPNPVAPLKIADNKTYRNTVLTSLFLEFKPVEWLTLKTMPSIIGGFFHRRDWFPSYESGVRSKTTATLREEYSESIDLSWENQLTFSKQFGKHDITVTGVTTARKYDRYSSDVRANGFTYESLPTLQNSTDRTVSGPYTPIRWNSYLGRFIYNYDSKYLLTASIRRDGVSRFGESNRWGNFPAASLAWKMNEDLFPDVQFIDMLKLRVGYGQTGNSNIGEFQYSSNLSPFTDFSPVIGGNVVPALNVLRSVGNPVIKWESSEMTNFGVDANLFGNRLTTSVEYYIKRTEDLLVQREISQIFGRTNGGKPWVNLADMVNKGFELQTSFRKKEGDFNYELSGTITTIQNEIINIPEEIKQNDLIAREGKSMGSIFGYVAERIITPEDFDENGEFKYAKPDKVAVAPGDLKFEDLNLDGKIDDNDRTIIGKAIPDFIYSLSINLSYKDFDFSMFWYGSQNVQVYNQLRSTIESFSSQDLNHNKSLEYSQNYYREDRPSTEFVRADLGNVNQNDRISTWWVEDASFIKLRDIQLGYSIPKNVLNKIDVGQVRFYVGVSNLLTITKYSGRDPESPTNGGSLDIGTEEDDVYPIPTIYSAGVQVNF